MNEEDARRLNRPVAIGEVNFLGRCSEMLARTRAHSAAWDSWYGLDDDGQPIEGSKVTTDDRLVECPSHPGTPLKLDREASQRKSWKDHANRIVFKPCLECQKAIVLARDNEFLKEARVPRALWHCTLDNWEAETPEDRETLEYARSYAKNPVGAFLLMGRSTGVGKTHLAIGMLRVIKRQSVFVDHPTFLKQMRDRYNDKAIEDIVSVSMGAGVLLFDELGMTSGGADDVQNLHLVFNTRFGDERPTIITSNIQDLNDLKPVLEYRMADRLRDFVYAARLVTGKTRRGTKARKPLQ